MLTRNHCSSCLSLGPRLLLPVAFCAKDLPPSPYLSLTPFPRTVCSFSSNLIFAVLITCTQLPSSVIRVEFSPLLDLRSATSHPHHKLTVVHLHYYCLFHLSPWLESETLAFFRMPFRKPGVCTNSYLAYQLLHSRLL